MSEIETQIPNIDAVKAKMRATWSAGDFGKIAMAIQSGAEDFIDRLDIKPGERVLDVACGTGNLAIPAARTGATVTGIDIAPNLVEQSRLRAAAEGLECKFEEGDAEQMPYGYATFDTVVTMFGAMFAPRPDIVAEELIRVCRAGGRIAMGNWGPGGFVGQMFKIGSKYNPLPPNMHPPVLWGDEATVRERLKDDITEITCSMRPITFRFDFPPADVVEHFRLYFGPTQVTFNSLDADGQAALRRELEELWTDRNEATDGTTRINADYLEVIAIRE